MKSFTPTSEKICIICGQRFMPRSRAQRICDREHTNPCPVCGKPVKIQYKSDFKKCCSVECSSKLRRMTNLQRYGVDNPSKSEEIRSKVVETCWRRYGAASPLQVPKFRAKSSKNNNEENTIHLNDCNISRNREYENIVRPFLSCIFPSLIESVQLDFSYNGVNMSKEISFCAGDTYVDCMSEAALKELDKQSYASEIYRMYSRYNVLIVTDIAGSLDASGNQRFKYIGHDDLILHGADIQIFQENRSELLVSWPSFNFCVSHLTESILNQKLSDVNAVWNSLVYWTSVEGGFVNLGSIVQAMLSPMSPTYMLKDSEGETK